MTRTLMLSTVILAACASHPPNIVTDRHSTAPIVVMIGAGHACLPGQRDIGPLIKAAMTEAEEKLQSLGLRDIRHVEADSDVLAELGRARTVPLIVIFAGHGALIQLPDASTTRELPESPNWVDRCSETGAGCMSVGCVGKPLSFDAMVRAVAPSVPWAFFVLDACTSAHVDVRRARTRVAVASVSPFGVDAHLTLMLRAIADLNADELDRNCDGITTDLEFFRALDAAFCEGGERGAFHAFPKLRRQSAEPFAVLTKPRRAACQPQIIDAYHGTRKISADSYETQDPLPMGNPLLWDGRAIPAASLRVTPCDEDVGQCFREYDP